MKRFWIVVFLLSAFACKDKNETAEKNELDSYFEDTLPDDFREFYEQFHKDSIYQIDHIIFPLAGVTIISPDNPTHQDTLWQKNSWIIHKPFNDMKGTFKRSFTNFKEIITESTSDYTGQFSMIRRFAKVGNEWHLIFYKEMGPN